MTEKNKRQLFAELKERVDRFHMEAGELSLMLVELVKDIDAGKLPKADVLTNTSDKIASVGDLRKLCESSYRKFDHDELPASFDEFSDEIIRIESLLDKTEYIETKDFLLRLSVHDENVAELFDQLKKELLGIDIDAMSMEECSQIMDKYVSLKKMLTVDPKERTGYMLSLANVFDEKILSLAITEEYSLNDTAETAVEAAKEKNAETGEDVQKTKTNVAGPEKKTVKEEYEETEEKEAAEDTSDTESKVGAFKERYGKDLDTIIKETGYEFFDYDSLDILLEETESQAKKQFSVKKFKDGLRSTPNDFSVRMLLTALGSYRAFYHDIKKNTFGYWPDMLKDKELKLEEGLDYLYRKGYVRFLSAGGYPKTISPTRKCEELFNSKTACEALGQEFVKYDRLPDVLTDPEAYMAQLLRIRSFEMIGDQERFTDHFSAIYQILYGDSPDIVYSCAAIKNEEQLETYLNEIALYTEGKNLKEFHILQKTKEQAEAIRSMLTLLDNGGITADTKLITHWYDEEAADGPQDVCEPDEEAERDEANVKEETPAVTEEAEVEKEEEKKETKAEEKTEEDTFNVNEKIEDFINQGRLYCATAYAGAYAYRYGNNRGLYEKLAYAVNDPAAHCVYTSDNLFNIYTEFETNAEHYYYASAVLRLFFSGQSQYDYNLQQMQDSLNGNPALSENKALSGLIYELKNFRSKSGYAIDLVADYRSHDRVETEKELEVLKRDASNIYEYDFVQRSMHSKRINKRFEITWQNIFSAKKDFATYVKAVCEDNTSYLELAKDYLTETFIRDGMPLSSENVDQRKIDELIDDEWDKAIDQISLRMKSSDLMGAARNNLRQHILKGVDVICSWVELRDALGKKGDDRKAYNAVKPKLTELLNEAEAVVEKQKGSAEKSTKAGLNVLLKTIGDMKAKLDGTYKLSDQRYFYLDFLKTNLVILGEDYLPDFECTIPSVPGMEMMSRIERHAGSEGVDLVENLNRYCEDNYGSAKLIADYLKKTTGKEPEIMPFFEKAEKNAAGQLELTHEGFESDLDLAQSYGQLDADDAEAKKDELLHKEDRWYAWAEETENYGFYNELLAEIRQQIKNDAEGRGKIIREELDSILSSDNSLERDHADYVERIKKTIAKQNYLVAEDMINHLLAGDIPQDTELFENDYLSEFQKRYPYYYKLAGSSGENLANRVKTNDLRKLSNKNEKGAMTLKGCWATPGNPVTEEKLRTMLNTLGITVDKMALSDKTNSVFSVRVAKQNHEDDRSYGHPVYGFGSVAARNGFRVIWLSGAYNTDALIAKIRELGKSKHTIVFLDYSLTENERRRLARKMKEEGSLKIVGVIDRVLYMYLLHNYSETYIARMLMETMMPYSYFQPYVYESAQQMPPEMFMGRKEELEKIVDPAGVNIVYGGRQLGKSALLRKAKEDINGDPENGKAILIDIKDLDHEAAAKKISQTLLDEEVIEEKLTDESDWGELARTIKNVLRESNRIKYLLLMLDEADKFLESCEEVGYSPFNALKDIQQSVDPGRFKFVVAGLRNVVRFNKKATSGNSVLPHLEPLVIKPFTTLEARMLLEQPLYYLGFRFPEENADLVPMILATANYFPGLIQLYCAKLIEALKRNYGGYDESKTPPYIIEESLIKKVLAEPDFRNEIREKFMITLRVGDDEYYYILALILAYLYRGSDSDSGYSAADILNEAKNLGTKYISDMDAGQVDALLKELCELNVMRVTSDNKYLFSRYSFLSMLGTSDEVDDDLLSYSE